MIKGITGKTLHGAEVLKHWYDYTEIPEEILEMGRKFGHEPSSSTGNWHRGIAKVKGKLYLADLRWTPDAGNECMIFRRDKDGNVLESGRSYYSRQDIPLTTHGLLKCVDEFAREVNHERE